MPIFESAEYQARIDKTRRRMNAAGIHVLVVCDPANMNYLTGYDGWSFYVPQAVVLGPDAREPIWVGRQMDAAGAHHTTFLAPENIRGYPDEYVQARDKHPMEIVAKVIEEFGWHKGPVGVEMDAYYFTAKSFQSLKESLPGADFIDADLLVNWTRCVKSEAEIDLMKQAGKIVELAMGTAIDRIDPGVRECDAVADIYQTQIRGTETFGGDYPAIVPLMPSGEKTSTPHLTWSDDPYPDNVAVNLELAGCRHRYHSPLARTLYLGKNPPTKLIDTASVVAEGMEAALAAVKPGAPCEAVEAAWRKVISRAGLEKSSRIGYSMGLNYPPDWGEHTASLRPGDQTELVPNMTFHMILGMWMDAWGFELSESFRVTPTGHETFAVVPRRLFLKS